MEGLVVVMVGYIDVFKGLQWATVGDVERGEGKYEMECVLGVVGEGQFGVGGLVRCCIRGPGGEGVAGGCCPVIHESGIGNVDVSSFF